MTNPEARSLRFYCSGRNAIALRTHPDFYHDIFKDKKKGKNSSLLLCTRYSQFIRYGSRVFFKYLSALNFV